MSIGAFLTAGKALVRQRLARGIQLLLFARNFGRRRKCDPDDSSSSRDSGIRFIVDADLRIGLRSFCIRASGKRKLQTIFAGPDRGFVLRMRIPSWLCDRTIPPGADSKHDSYNSGNLRFRHGCHHSFQPGDPNPAKFAIRCANDFYSMDLEVIP